MAICRKGMTIMENSNGLATVFSLTNEKRYHLTDEIGQESTKLVGLITSEKYVTYAELIHEITSELDICIKQTEKGVFYTTSEEDYDAIVKELDKILA